MFGQIAGGLFVIACGGCVMYFANTLADVFGPSARAQKYFGGTRNAILSIGFVGIVIGFLVLFGVFAPSVTNVGSLQVE